MLDIGGVNANEANPLNPGWIGAGNCDFEGMAADDPLDASLNESCLGGAPVHPQSKKTIQVMSSPKSRSRLRLRARGFSRYFSIH
ncbi:MAG: hypothetical protein HC857_03855 [Synechococcales cyanobacterium RU_4_20]|nr:hypothetical protein [Synechococcales cyanobacterium RU_4_20]